MILVWCVFLPPVAYEHLYSLKVASLFDQELRSHHIITAKNIHHIKRLNGPLVNGIIKKSHLKIAGGRRVCTSRLVDHRVFFCFVFLMDHSGSPKTMFTITDLSSR